MPEARKSGRADDRKIMNAIFYVLRTGMPWRDLPERYGPYTEPPPLKWSDLKYVSWHQGGSERRGRDTSRKRLSRSCGRLAASQMAFTSSAGKIRPPPRLCVFSISTSVVGG